MLRDNHTIDNRKLRKVFNRFITGIDFYLDGTEVCLNSHGAHYTRMIAEYLLTEKGKAMLAIANDIDYRVRVNYLAESVAGKVYKYPTHVCKARHFRKVADSDRNSMVAEVVTILNRADADRLFMDMGDLQKTLEAEPELGTLEITRLPEAGITEYTRAGESGRVLSIKTLYDLKV